MIFTSMFPLTLQVGVKLIPIYQNKILVLKRNPKVYEKVAVTLWDIPGGRIDPTDDLMTNLDRELGEETGLTLARDVKLPLLLAAQDIFVPHKGLHVVRLTYIGYVTGKIRLSDEHIEHALIALDEQHEAFGPDTYAGHVRSSKHDIIASYIS